jgi:hypothetical protein
MVPIKFPLSDGAAIDHAPVFFLPQYGIMIENIVQKLCQLTHI